MKLVGHMYCNQCAAVLATSWMSIGHDYKFIRVDYMRELPELLWVAASGVKQHTVFTQAIDRECFMCC